MNTTQNIRYLHKKLEDVSKNVYCLKQYVKNNPGGGGSEGDYVLTSAKIVNALGYTPISNTHASNNITQTLINSWNGAVTNSHTHLNKNVLDATTASFTNTLKTKLDGLENYQLTSTKITTALGFTPMNSAHPASAVTSAKINSWDGKLDKPTTNGEIVSAIGFDAGGVSKKSEVVEIASSWTSGTAPTSTQLTDAFPNAMFVLAVNLTVPKMYIKSGGGWKSVNLETVV